MEPTIYKDLYLLESNHWWYQGMRQISDQLLKRHLGNAQGLKILDAGCGVGGNLSALSRFGCVLGFDLSLLALSYASLNHRGKLARATIEALPYADNSFDLVTSFDVLMCQEIKQDVAALREIARVTRPGAYVLVRVAALNQLRGQHDHMVHAIRRYSESDLRHKMVSAGLAPVQTSYANSVLMPFVFVIRTLQRLAVNRGAVPKSDVTVTPQTINNLLTAILNLEGRWLGNGHRFPAGVSLYCLATKPHPVGTAHNGKLETKYQRLFSSI